MVQCFISHITQHRHQVLLGHVFTLLGRLLRLGTFSVKSSVTTHAHFAVPFCSSGTQNFHLPMYLCDFDS